MGTTTRNKESYDEIFNENYLTLNNLIPLLNDRNINVQNKTQVKNYLNYKKSIKNKSKIIDTNDIENWCNLNLKDIDAIAYTRGPGLGPCLRVIDTSCTLE